MAFVAAAVVVNLVAAVAREAVDLVAAAKEVVARVAVSGTAYRQATAFRLADRYPLNLQVCY